MFILGMVFLFQTMVFAHDEWLIPLYILRFRTLPIRIYYVLRLVIVLLIALYAFLFIFTTMGGNKSGSCSRFLIGIVALGHILIIAGDIIGDYISTALLHCHIASVHEYGIDRFLPIAGYFLILGSFLLLLRSRREELGSVIGVILANPTTMIILTLAILLITVNIVFNGLVFPFDLQPLPDSPLGLWDMADMYRPFWPLTYDNIGISRHALGLLNFSFESILAMWFFIWGVKLHRRVNNQQCLACGYQLSRNTNSHCSECGCICCY